MMNFAEECLEEIALEGLDGITLSALWIRLAARKPAFSLLLDDKTKQYLWSSLIRGHKTLEFYQLPNPRLPLVLYDRFQNVDPETGVIVQADDCSKDIYPVCVIKDNLKGIMGSCECFSVRTNITDLVRNDAMDLNSVIERWGEMFVIVASQRLRSRALFGCRQIDPDVLASVTDIKYAVLERIGRSRYHGEVTQSEDGLKAFDLQPKSMFYIRKVLRNVGLITVQPICIRCPNGMSVSGKLTHLTRFCVEYRPMYSVWLEDMTKRLSIKPQQRELFSKIRTEMGLNEKTFKKLCGIGKNNFRREVLKYRDMYPESDEKDYMRKSQSAERCLHTIRLIKPFKVSQLLEDDDDDDNEDRFGRGKEDDNDREYDDLDLTVANVKDMGNKGSLVSLVVERPMIHQALSCIEQLSGKGQSMLDISARFGITKLDSRNICRNLSRKGCVISVMQDEGKNRVSRFASKRAIANVVQPTGPFNEIKEKAGSHLQVEEVKQEEDSFVVESSLNQSLDLSSAFDRELITNEAREKEELLKKLEIFPDITTIRVLRRANTILTAVKQAKIVSDLLLIQKKIRSEEGSGTMMDRKSFVRIVNRLGEGQKIKQIVHKVVLSSGQEKELVFLCDPSVNDDDPLVKNAVEAAHQKLFACKAETKNSQKAVKDEKAENLDDLVYDPAACKRYSYLSRMARFKTLHQLLWYLVYGKALENPAETETDVLPGNGQHSEDFCQMQQTEEASDDTLKSHLKMLYWHKMLPKLPQHTEYGEGWCCIFDVLQVIPVFVISQIFSLPYRINGLESFLEDPVKRLTPYNQLPREWQKIISFKRRYISSFHNDCKCLAQLGLLTFGKRDYKQKEQGFLYIHKRASLIDTTCANVPPSDFVRHLYKFDSFSKVDEYWLSMQSISFNTPQENLLVNSRPRYENDGRFNECLREKEVDQVVDVGIQPGDKMGGAGTDSSFFTHLRRNWSRNADLDVKMESLITDGQYLANERAMTRALLGKTKKKRGNSNTASQDSQVKNTKSGKAGKDSSLKYAKVSMSGVVLTRGGKGTKHKRRPALVEGLLKKSKRIHGKRTGKDSENASHAAVPAKRHIKLDSKDIDAMRLLKRHRVTWTSQEDSLLLLCQLTNQFLTGNLKLYLVGKAVIRDIMHENLAVSRDKTRLACSRRIKYMMKNRVTVQNVHVYLGEALQDRDLVAEFKEGKKYVMSNVAENEVVFKRCLAKMREKFRCESESIPDIPDTPEEFFERFSLIKNCSSGETVHQDVTSAAEISYSVLHNLIHSAIVLTDKIGRSHELFQLFQMYPDSVLQSVSTSMKNDKILTKIKKCNVNKNRFGGIPISTIGAYQISQRYLYYWLSTYARSLFAAVGKSLQHMPSRPEDSYFFAVQNTPSECAITVALMSIQMITFQTVIPEQIVVIEKISAGKDSRPPTKKRKVEDVSDLEEEELIEKAERDRLQNAANGDQGPHQEQQEFPNATPSVLNTSSRTVLSCQRSQYVHGKTVRLINADDNLYVNACDIHIRLKSCELQDVNSDINMTSWANDVEAHKKLTHWNKTHVMLHPKTCHMILKTIRTVFPDRIRTETAFENCHLRTDDEVLLQSLHLEIKQRECLGLTVYELKRRFSNVEGIHLMEHLAMMVDCKLIIRVGVTVFRYVCLEFASSWLIRIDKNLKGRGNFHVDEDDDVQFRTGDKIRVEKDVSSSVFSMPEGCVSPNNTRQQTENSYFVRFQNPSETEQDQEADRKTARVNSSKRGWGEVGDMEKLDEPCFKSLKLDKEITEREQNLLETGQALPAKSLLLGNANFGTSLECVDVCEENSESPSDLTFSVQASRGPSNIMDVVVVNENPESWTDKSQILADDSSSNAKVNQTMNDPLFFAQTDAVAYDPSSSVSADQKIDDPSSSFHDEQLLLDTVLSSVTYPCHPPVSVPESLSVLPQQTNDLLVTHSLPKLLNNLETTTTEIILAQDTARIIPKNSVNGLHTPDATVIHIPDVAKSNLLPETPIETSMNADETCIESNISSVLRSSLPEAISSQDASLPLIQALGKVSPGHNKKQKSSASEQRTSKEPFDISKTMLTSVVKEDLGSVSIPARESMGTCCGSSENTDRSSETYFSSLINSVPKVLKRPRDFMKGRLPSERSGRTKAPKGSRSIRMPTWMVETEHSLCNDVLKSPCRKNSQEHQTSAETLLDDMKSAVKSIQQEVSTGCVSPHMRSSANVFHFVPHSSASQQSFDSTKNISSSRSRDELSTSPVLSSSLKEQAKPEVVGSPDNKVPSVVRLASSGTCTTITVLPKEKKNSNLNIATSTGKAQSSSLFGSDSGIEIGSLSMSASNNASNSASFSKDIHSGNLALRSVRPNVCLPNLPSVITTRPSVSPLNISSMTLPDQGFSQVGNQTRSKESPMSLILPAGMSSIPDVSHSQATSVNQYTNSLPKSASGLQGTSPSQSIRIRIPAASLNTFSETGDLTRHIQAILARQGSLKPGQQFRLRLPPGLSPSDLGIAGSATGSCTTRATSEQHQITTDSSPCTAKMSSDSRTNILTTDPGSNADGQTTHVLSMSSNPISNLANEQELLTSCGDDQSAVAGSDICLPQLDGATDEDSADSTDILTMTFNETNSKVIGETDDQESKLATGNHNSGISKTKFLSKCLMNDDCRMEVDRRNLQNVVGSGSSVENSRANPPSTVPQPTGTYKKVQLVPRPWRTPEGTVNRTTLQTMLEAVMIFIIENPGTTRDSLVKKYNPVLQPVAVFELLELLEEIGCLERTYLKRSHKPSLFSSRSRYNVVTEDTGSETEIFLPTAAAILKLGQFVVQLTSGLRPAVS